MRRFAQIKGLSEIRRLPLLGRIRGGVKVKKKGGDSRCKHKPEELCGYCARPVESAGFIVPPEVARVYGEKPTELDIMLPVNDLTQVFPQALEMYGSGRGLKCTGDRSRALRYNETTKSMEEIDCPCELLEQKKCHQRAHLSFILPKVSVGGVYMFTTTSFHSIVDINSSLDYVTALIGRFAMVPLKLKREPRITHHDGMQQTHYTCRLELEGNVDFLNALKESTSRILAGPQYALPAPVLENPELDDGAVVLEEPIEVETAAPSFTLEIALERITGAKSLQELTEIGDWIKAGVSVLPKDDGNHLRERFKARGAELETQEAQTLLESTKVLIAKAPTKEAVDLIFEEVGSKLKDNTMKVKLKFARDARVQEFKNKA